MDSGRPRILFIGQNWTAVDVFQLSNGRYTSTSTRRTFESLAYDEHRDHAEIRFVPSQPRSSTRFATLHAKLNHRAITSFFDIYIRIIHPSGFFPPSNPLPPLSKAISTAPHKSKHNHKNITAKMQFTTFLCSILLLASPALSLAIPSSRKY